VSQLSRMDSGELVDAGHVTGLICIPVFLYGCFHTVGFLKKLNMELGPSLAHEGSAPSR